jgi:hypothetical protein
VTTLRIAEALDMIEYGRHCASRFRQVLRDTRSMIEEQKILSIVALFREFPHHRINQ